MCNFKHRNFLVALVVALGLLLSACATHTETAAPETTDTSLYARLGGQTAIAAVVDEFIANVAADTRINRFFANTDIPRLKVLLVEQICAGTGGPCQYTGKDMKTAHEGLGITGADFNALVEDLVKALDKFNVPEQEKQELLAILGPMQTDIVER